MKAIKLFKAIISPPTKDLIKIKQELKSLEKEMLLISKMDNKVEAIVRLFQVVSPLQDKGGFKNTISNLQKKNHGQLDQIITAIEILQVHLTRTGRSEFGLNRTKIGEEVTPDKVFLGDVWGLWTKPASYWLSNKKRFEVEDSGVTPTEASGLKFVPVWYCINDYQAGKFVKGHTEGIIQQIATLKKVA